MILELLPAPIGVVYIKMQHALSMQGHLDALREVLDELEWNVKTRAIFKVLLDRMRNQEKADLIPIEDSIKWIKTQFKLIQKCQWKNASTKKLILDGLLPELEAIEDGKRALTNYLQGLVSLFKKVAELIASFGEFDILKAFGKTQMLSVSFPPGVDPLKTAVVERTEIEPFTDEGNLVMTALNSGFTKAEVLPPVNGYKTNRYFIKKGMITIQWPESIKKALSTSHEDWRVSLDKSVTRCLHYLFCVAGWQDWFAEDNRLKENPSEKHLNWFYNRQTMRHYLSQVLTDPNQQQIRGDVKAVLDRLLSVFAHEMTEGKGKRNNKERAEKHAYLMVKSILLPYQVEERKQFTIDKVVSMILDDLKHQDLIFDVLDAHCKAACKLFETTHGWPKKRGPDTKPREKRVSSI